ncbi:MAG: membrane dipeptidase [Gammaproteobacteria bacterium]|nr:membrane dipeptidase [Gammaproteobacteria bacterium]
MIIIDGLQYVNWNRELFQKAKDAGVTAIHVTIAYWENTRETLANIGDWHRLFRKYPELIMPVRTSADISSAQRSGRVGIVFGFQNCSPIEDDLRLVQVFHELGVRVMQLSYNNQSLLAAGCYEADDSGITRFGKEVIQEMNRVGMLIDMSHSAERSTLEAMELSSRPIAITHANPAFFHDALRNKSTQVLEALGESGGMLGLSLYPFHLKNGSDCTLESFCSMAVKAAEIVGVTQLGIGSDLCQNWDYSTLEWMRSGRWTADTDYGEGSADNQDWPRQPNWFASSRDFTNIASGLEAAGFGDADVRAILGENWLNFFEQSFGPADESN